MMSLAEQALFLLDIQPNIRNRKNPENFSSLEQTIVASFPVTSDSWGAAAAVEVSSLGNGAAAVLQSSPFSVASRMSRSNYEDQARAEALTQALRQIRASHATANNARRQS